MKQDVQKTSNILFHEQIVCYTTFGKRMRLRKSDETVATAEGFVFKGFCSSRSACRPVILGKDEVGGSSPPSSSKPLKLRFQGFYFLPQTKRGLRNYIRKPLCLFNLPYAANQFLMGQRLGSYLGVSIEESFTIANESMHSAPSSVTAYESK